MPKTRHLIKVSVLIIKRYFKGCDYMSIEIIHSDKNKVDTNELYDILVDIIIQNEGGLNEENDGGTLAC